jgi:hypothetical protein
VKLSQDKPQPHRVYASNSLALNCKGGKNEIDQIDIFSDYHDMLFVLDSRAPGFGR